MTHSYGWRWNTQSRSSPMRWRLQRSPAPIPVDLRSGCSPVRDQGNLGSCTAFEGTGAAEYEAIRQGIPFAPISPLFLYYCERLDQGDTADDTGSSISESMTAMNKYGLAPESEWSYDTSKFANTPTDQVFTDAKRQIVMKWEAVDQTLDFIRSVLQAKLLAAFGFQVYESFESDTVASTGLVPMPGTTEKVLGSHANLIVGDEPDQRRLICRNSWSPQWGDKGYYYQNYDFLLDPNNASDFWAVQLIGPSAIPLAAPGAKSP